jgi:Fur family ferric uptake transcriptional regulator
MRKRKEELELFHSYLHQNGLKKTYQKDLILELFLDTEGHRSVEDVYALVKKRDKKIGIVTVFRTLKSLAACGIAREIMLGDGLTRFEHSYHHPLHHHIVCTECNKAVEYACPALEKIQDDIIRKYRFQPQYHRFQSYGICEDCREKRPASDAQKHDTERIFARDAIKMALCMEARCLEFYSECAKHNRDAGGRDVFERMVQEEQRHIADLTGKLEELVKEERNLEHAPIFLHFDAHDLEALIPDVAKCGNADEFRLDAKASADLVIQLNQKTTDFFKEYAEMFEETQGKRFLLSFAEQEEAHRQYIQQRIRERPSEAGVVA